MCHVVVATSQPIVTLFSTPHKCRKIPTPLFHVGKWAFNTINSTWGWKPRRSRSQVLHAHFTIITGIRILNRSAQNKWSHDRQLHKCLRKAIRKAWFSTVLYSMPDFLPSTLWFKYTETLLWAWSSLCTVLYEVIMNLSSNVSYNSHITQYQDQHGSTVVRSPSSGNDLPQLSHIF